MATVRGVELRQLLVTAGVVPGRARRARPQLQTVRGKPRKDNAPEKEVGRRSAVPATTHSTVCPTVRREQHLLAAIAAASGLMADSYDKFPGGKFGKTCRFFRKNGTCPNPNCQFRHTPGNRQNVRPPASCFPSLLSLFPALAAARNRQQQRRNSERVDLAPLKGYVRRARSRSRWSSRRPLPRAPPRWPLLHDGDDPLHKIHTPLHLAIRGIPRP